MTSLDTSSMHTTADVVGTLAPLQAALRQAVIAWLEGARTLPAAPLAALRTLRGDVVRFVQGAHRQRVMPLVVRRLAGNVVAGALPLGTSSEVAEGWALATRRLVDEVYLLGEHLG